MISCSVFGLFNRSYIGLGYYNNYPKVEDIMIIYIIFIKMSTLASSVREFNKDLVN